MREIKFRAWMGDAMKEFDFFDIYGGEFDGGSHIPSEVMQYTGLKDKNGTEIYEGDIVKSLGEQDYTFGVRPVVFERGEFTVEGYGLTCGLVKVIGNIYENPEMLK